MGEAQEWLFEPDFNHVKVRASDERITDAACCLKPIIAWA
jgi:hypothetical protein